MLQIWAGNVNISWSHGEGRSIASGDEIAKLSGEKDAVLSMERTPTFLGNCLVLLLKQRNGLQKHQNQIACTRKTIWGLMDNGQSTLVED